MIELRETAPPVSPVSRADLERHLRLAQGFSVDAGEEALLDRHLLAATRAVEARTGRALSARGFALDVAAWDRDGCLRMPIGPVAEVASLTITLGGATLASLAAADLGLGPGASGQRLARASGAALPAIPPGGRASLAFSAGYAAGAVPEDLLQAVLVLAGRLHDARDGERGRHPGGLPSDVRALLAPYQPVRL